MQSNNEICKGHITSPPSYLDNKKSIRLLSTLYCCAYMANKWRMQKMKNGIDLENETRQLKRIEQNLSQKITKKCKSVARA